MITEYKKPDLNGPQYRPRKVNLLNQAFYDRFTAKHPKYKELSLHQVKDVVKVFNGAIWNTVVNTRDGVELPEQLGYLFIGTCPRKKGDNPDIIKSINYGVKTQNQNWESDQNIAKVFYTNFETKYRFKYHELWGFKAVRDFRREIAQVYPHNWKRYVVIDNMQQVSKMFRKQRYKQYKEQQEVITPQSYDEFDFD